LTRPKIYAEDEKSTVKYVDLQAGIKVSREQNPGVSGDTISLVSMMRCSAHKERHQFAVAIGLRNALLLMGVANLDVAVGQHMRR
jgi:hypothetical protein